jgi:GR25 family glycosyltransferase involved in LPS biosynthesis
MANQVDRITMKLNEFFDQIYCINLDRRIDRWQNVEKEFDRLNITVERFTACDGKELLEQLPQEAKSDIKLSPGELGLAITHQALLVQSMERNHKSILILEDDVRFVDDFNEKFDRYSEEVPIDWDMLYLGGNLDHWKPTQITQHVHKGHCILTTHSVGLKDTIFQHMNDCMNHKTPVDVVYGWESIRFHAYSIMPRLAFQSEGYSDIQGIDLDYQFLRTGQWEEHAGSIR